MEKEAVLDVKSVSVSFEDKPIKKIKNEDELLREKHQMYKNGMRTLKQMYKDMDPAVIKNEKNIRGDIKISMKYVLEQSMLLIKVLEARNLQGNEIRGRTFHPYVQVEVLLATTMLPVNNTSHAKSRNPVFNEIFATDVKSGDLKDCKIRFTMYSFDGSGNDDFLGELVIKLSEISCVEKACTMWRELQPHVDLSINGSVKMALTYKLPRTLGVTIQEVKGVNSKPNGNVYVRLFIPGVTDVYKTWPISASVPLIWNELYEFNVPKEELESRTVIVMVLDSNHPDAYYGECHISLSDFNISRGYLRDFPLADMRGSNVVRSRWSRNNVTQELQEAMFAHAIYMRPSFMFDDASDVTKTVSVTVPKAGSHSRRRVVGGIIIR